jgi:hypothetical protein
MNVDIGSLQLGNDRPLVLISGPCQIESRDHAIEVAGALVEMCRAAGIGLIFKSSYDKANRTSAAAARGIGMDKGLAILAEVRARFGCPVLTDVHAPEHCAPAAQAVDVLQIPAFLCRQTDLLLAAGETGAAVNVKKGQFLAPWDMVNVAAKIASTGRLSRGVRRDAFGAAAGRAGHLFGRAARVRAGAGARGGGGWRGGGVHRGAPRPRRGAERRAEHDPAARDAGADRPADGVRRPGQGGLIPTS